MAIKKRILRRPGKGSGVAPSPLLISSLAYTGSLRAMVRLEIRLGNPPFDVLEETADGEAEGEAILRRAWPLHAEVATEYCIRHYGPGLRPALWWEGRQRPFVRPRDWRLEGDSGRFDKERKAADLNYLREHGLLSREEITALAETKKIFGPEEDG